MKVLIGCEESQAVCIEFRKMGIEAYSCDIQECSGGHPEWHIQGDVLEQLYSGRYDAAIVFPPCTYITNAGIGYFNEERYGQKAVDRKELRRQAVEFFMKCYNAPVGMVCCENPVGFINSFMKPTQVIHPYFFGDPHKKRTCLWLRGFPPLAWAREPNLFQLATACDEPKPIYVHIRKPGKHYKGGEHKPRYFTDAMSGGMGKERSKTFPGIARAMAEQWGKILLEQKAA